MGVDGIEVAVSAATPLTRRAGLLALPVFEEELAERRGDGPGLIAALDRRLGGHLAAAVRSERFKGRPGEQLLLTTVGRLPAERVLLLGMGPRSAAASWLAGAEPLRAAAGKAARLARQGTLAIALPDPGLQALGAPSPATLAGLARACVEGALLGAYRFDRYRSGKERQPGLSGVTVLLPPGTSRAGAVAEEVALGRRVAEATAWARDLVNLGPAECTPRRLAAAAQALARQARLRCTVRGPRQIAALRMGLFQAVARGSAEPAALVSLSWLPPGAARRRPPLVLVGKAVTFDSGGLSLKPSDSMITMHTDMAGAAAVVAAMRVVAALRPPFPVHAVFGACENMPGGRAYKPSDVVTAHGGQTVEITNTDAEGRLVLGDVLSWAAATWKPGGLVDLATLTGACVVALGHTTAGLFGPDGPVVEAVAAAARRAGEDVWRLPLTESCADNLKSERADLKNSGERMGSAIAAAHFLKRFTRDAPWAHLDIAGPSHTGREKGYLASGGTGFGVRTLVELVRGWRAEPPRPSRAGLVPPRASRPGSRSGAAPARRKTAAATVRNVTARKSSARQARAGGGRRGRRR